MMHTYREKLSNYSIYPWLIFISVTTATFMVNIDSSILNVALPVLEDYFQVNPQTLQWVVSSYLLVITGILPAVGKLSDIIGRKKMFIIGLSVFVVGSILSAISMSIGQLIFYRGIQGIGGAIMQGNVMSIIAYTFPQGSRGKALGIIGSVVAAGTIVGPSLGGFLIKLSDWRSIFWINLPIGLLGIIGSFILLPEDKKSKLKGQFDYLGSALFFIAMSSLLLYVSNGQDFGYLSILSISLLVITGITWIGFILWEQRTKIPLIELSFFRNSVFSVGVTVGFLSFILIMLPSILLPLYLHNVLGLEVEQIGFIMASQAVAMMFAAPVSGWLTDRIGSDWPAILGMLVNATSLYLLGQLSASTHPIFIVVAISLFGIGMGLFQSPNNVSVLESVPVEKTGITGGIIATVRNFGRVSGVAIAILLFSLNYNVGGSLQSYSQAIGTVFNIGSVLSILSVILLVARFRMGHVHKKVENN